MSEFFLTQLINTAVLDKNGEEVGLLSDLLIGAYGETFPKITGVEIRSRKEKKILSKDDIDLLSHRVVTLRTSAGLIVSREPAPEDLFLARDFLDKQILDIHGAKVVRVNDLKIAYLNKDFHLIAADVGFRGLLRRMNLEKSVNQVLHWVGKPLQEHLIPWNFVEPISSGHPKVKLTVPQSKITQLHPADIAEILKDLAPAERTAVMESLNEEMAAEALHDVAPQLSLEILDDLTPEKAASILEEMNPDDAADILAELPEEHRRHILSGMDAEEAADLKELLLHHDEETAGGLMTPEYISLPDDLTAEQTINRLRELSPEAETIYYLYVVNQNDHLEGVVSLRDLIVAKPNLKLKEFMTTKIIKVATSAKKEEVAELIAKYDLLALPVVDESKKLVGIITVDDAMDLLIPQRRSRK